MIFTLGNGHGIDLTRALALFLNLSDHGYVVALCMKGVDVIMVVRRGKKYLLEIASAVDSLVFHHTQ